MPTTGEPPARRPVRADIQALRALAVTLVVVYHFWPHRISGGFVGVDVFFVISGFLITTHLIHRPPATLADLAEFWGRRIRRLLPASFLVLLVTFAAVLFIAPATLWSETAQEIAASALYVQNWFLANEAVDYLAVDSVGSPVQHFWSLSIEEQFYLVWPVLVLLAVMLGRRRGLTNTRTAIGVAVLAVIALSLTASVVITQSDPAAAYFVSWTRAWELAAGGLLACVYARLQTTLGLRPVARNALAILGLVMITYAAFFFDASTPFPGTAALVPVVGTLLVIGAAVPETRLSLHTPMALRPAQILGDVSYSLYLWHWPAVVLLPLLLDRPLTWPEKIAVIAALIALSWWTKVFVEDRFRGRGAFGRSLRRSYGFAGAGMALLCVASLAAVLFAQTTEDQAEEEVTAALESDDPCFGAAALADDAACDPHGSELITDPVFAAEDKPDPYEDDCWILRDFSEQRTCSYGSRDSDALRVALVGNSHAGHWLPALQEISADDDWAITTYLISECYTIDGTIEFETEEKTDNCRQWNRDTIAAVAEEDYDLVVMSNYTWTPMEGHSVDATLQNARDGYDAVLRQWADAEVPLLVIRDTPYVDDLDENVPDCVAMASGDLAGCDGDRDRLKPDPLAEVASDRGDPLVEVLDLTDRFCTGETCQSVVGGVIVYFDRSHLSATYAQTLAPELREAAARLLRDD